MFDTFPAKCSHIPVTGLRYTLTAGAIKTLKKNIKMVYTPYACFPDLLRNFFNANLLSGTNNYKFFTSLSQRRKTSSEKLSQNANTELPVITEYCIIQSCNKPLIIETKGLSHYCHKTQYNY